MKWAKVLRLVFVNLTIQKREEKTTSPAKEQKQFEKNLFLK